MHDLAHILWNWLLWVSNETLWPWLHKTTFPTSGILQRCHLSRFFSLQQLWYPVALQHYQDLTHWATFHHSQLREALQCQQNKDDKKGESNKKTVSTLSIVLSLTSGKIVMPCCSEEKKIFHRGRKLLSKGENVGAAIDNKVLVKDLFLAKVVSETLELR